MRPVDDKACYGHGGSAQENPSSNSYNFDFQNANLAQKARNRQPHQKVLGSRAKPTPSKWDDAQKWLVNLSAAAARDHGHNGGKPRNSNADDRRLLHSLSQRGRDSCSSVDGALDDDVVLAVAGHEEGETKKIDCGESLWRTSKPAEDPAMVVRSVCLRDMGTEMTPIASKEPSRTGTPLRATTPVLRSPISSRTSTPGRSRQGTQQNDNGNYQAGMRGFERRSNHAVVVSQAGGKAADGEAVVAVEGGKAAAEVNGTLQGRNPDPLEARAMAWDEAERAKYMARYKREEVQIQAWENQEKRRAEMELKRMEIKAERLKARAQEKLTNKLAAARRIAEEKRANAEAKLNEHAARTSEKAEYIRRTGHVPSSFFSFKLPSLCG